MSVRNELETLLSISQGATEDYQEYLLRMLEEANNTFDVSEASEAKGEDMYSKLTQKTKDWFNKGIEAYNGNQSIAEFPKIVIQVKVEPIITQEPIIFEESIFEQESKINMSDELQAATSTQFESISKQVSSPEIDAEIQENIRNIEESVPDIVSEEISNEEFRKQEDELFNSADEIFEEQEALYAETTVTDESQHVDSIDLVKKKRGRPKGIKNKENSVTKEPEFTENEPFHFEIGACEIPVKKKRGRKTGTKNKPKTHVKASQTVFTPQPDTITTIRILPPEGGFLYGNKATSIKDIKEYIAPKGKGYSYESLTTIPTVIVPEPSKEEIDCTTCDAAGGECSTSCLYIEDTTPSTHDYKLISESMDMETGEITPEFEITKIVSDISAHRRVTTPDGSLIWIPKTSVIESSQDRYATPFEDVTTNMDIIEEITNTIEEIPNNLRKYGLEASDKAIPEETIESVSIISKPQKPLDLFRTLVCQNYDKPFEEIFKLAETQCVDIKIKKSTATVMCSTIKATINTLKNLGMLKGVN